MFCPTCIEQPLKVTKLPQGNLYECPSCNSFFAPWDLLAQLSANKDQFLTTLKELQSFLLPMGRMCPQCLGKLQQARSKNGAILALCVTCESIWTHFSTLAEWNAPLERQLRLQLQSPSTPVQPAKEPKSTAASSREGDLSPLLQDTGFTLQREDLQSHYHALEKTLQQDWAKREEALRRSHQEELHKTRDEIDQTLQKRLSVLQNHIDELEKKRVDQETHLKNLKEQLEKKETLSLQLEQAKANDARQLKELNDRLHALEKMRAAPTPSSELKLVTPASSEPPKGTAPVELPKPSPVPNPILPPVVQKAVIPEKTLRPTPAPKTPLLKPLWMSFKKAWTPRAKPPVIPQPTPSRVVEKPIGQVVKPKPSPAPAPAPKPEPNLTPSVVPVTPRPAVTAQPKPVAKGPVKPIFWIDLLTTWVPRVLPWIAFLISYSIDEDAGWAFLWTLVVWAAGSLARLAWIYPLKPFSESLIADLPMKASTTKGRGIAVLLNGSLEDPKAKPLYFQDTSGRVLLNTLSPVEILPRLFGLISGNQFPPGELSVKGWYRGGTTPFIEVQEIRSATQTRKSLVRGMRWSLAGLTFLFGILLLLLAS